MKHCHEFQKKRSTSLLKKGSREGGGERETCLQLKHGIATAMLLLLQYVMIYTTSHTWVQYSCIGTKYLSSPPISEGPGCLKQASMRAGVTWTLFPVTFIDETQDIISLEEAIEGT